MLLVISDSTRRDLIKYARNQRVPLPPTVSVRLGDNIPDTKSEMPSSFREICPADFLLSVGTQEFRKNHVTLLNAYRYLIREENLLPPHLVLVGRQGWLDQNLEHQVKNDLDLEGRILLLHSMSDQGLAWLYQNCLFTLYPSIYEGWGLPVAESLCYGKPCISSCTSSLSEIAPGLVDLLPPLDVIAWATAIKRYSLDRAELAASASRIQDRYTPSKWSKTAGQLGDLASYLRGDLT
jgi:glycosyltransferase involved in cell wall biosynthesis